MRGVILGIDAQTRAIGFAFVTLAGEPIVADVVMLDGEGALEHQATRAIDRIAEITRDPVRAVVVERVGGGRGVQSMLAVANAAGIVAGILGDRYPDATMYRPTPGAWKRAAGLSGNANKVAVRARAEIWAPEIVTADTRQDAIDALLIAVSEAITLNRAAGVEIDALRGDLRASGDPLKGVTPPTKGRP